MSLTKLSLGGKKLNYSRPGRVWSVTSRLGTGKRPTLFYSAWGGRQSYMTLQPLPSEFPYIRENYFFFFSVIQRVNSMLCAQGRRNSWAELRHAGESGANSPLDSPRPRPVRPGAPSGNRDAQRRGRGAQRRQHRGRGTTPADECNGQLCRVLYLHRQQRAQVSPRFTGHPSSRPL